MSVHSVDEAFKGKSVIVTGAASGIGREIARQCAAAGANVLATDVVESIHDAAVQIGPGAESMVVDVSDRDQVAGAINRVIEEHGSLDFIFNNAGVAIFGEFETVTLDHWDKIIDVNLRGVAYGTKLAYDQMVKQQSGHIISTASVAGLVPVPLQAHYVATKHAVVGMHKTLELESRDHNIKSTVFCPAFIDTGMFDNNTLRGSLEGFDARKAMPFKPLSAEDAVKRLLDGVVAGKTIVITPFYGRLGWWMDRFSTPLSQMFHRFTLRETRKRAAKK
jgi:NAD(P)-dependent dehydrogenase (short-subunit alcohol dehydrogenase family)